MKRDCFRNVFLRMTSLLKWCNKRVWPPHQAICLFTEAKLIDSYVNHKLSRVTDEQHQRDKLSAARPDKHQKFQRPASASEARRSRTKS